MLEEERILEHMKTPITRRIRIRKYENADTDKNEKIFAVWIKTANYKFSRFQHFEHFPTNKLNKVDTKCSKFKSRSKFMSPVNFSFDFTFGIGVLIIEF